LISDRPSAPQYNKGEWTELLVLAELLCKGQVVVGKYRPEEPTRQLQVVSISRSSSSKADFIIDGEVVRIATTGHEVHRSRICAKRDSLLPAIRVGEWVFSTSEGGDLLDLLEISQLKTGSEKSDIFLDVLDPLTGATGLQGYTIKSFLGSSPTLFNAGLATNFTYEISPTISAAEIERLNSLPIRDMCKELIDSGHKLTLVKSHQTFSDNLTLLDSRMIDVISSAMLAYYSMRCGKSGRLQPIADFLAKDNPLAVSNPAVFYHHKLKDFLEAATYGMVPSKPWDGKRTAPGGLLIVDSSGDLVCIPPGNSDEHRSFLLQMTKFETASRTRHKFGSISQDKGVCNLTLNLQIRYQ
jgi:hypothetical protein